MFDHLISYLVNLEIFYGFLVKIGHKWVSNIQKSNDIKNENFPN